MNDVALQKQIDELTKEIRFAADASQTRLEDLRAQVDRIRIEMAAFRMALESLQPSFSEEFQQALEKARYEVDPESD
jgi:predicted  nucleic acid-binding Zn-ribbon protein